MYIVYTTKTCPYCIKVKDLLKGENKDFIEVDVHSIKEELSLRGINKVPQVFEIVGGFEDTKMKLEQDTMAVIDF